MAHCIYIYSIKNGLPYFLSQLSSTNLFCCLNFSHVNILGFEFGFVKKIKTPSIFFSTEWKLNMTFKWKQMHFISADNKNIKIKKNSNRWNDRLMRKRNLYILWWWLATVWEPKIEQKCFHLNFHSTHQMRTHTSCWWIRGIR